MSLMVTTMTTTKNPESSALQVHLQFTSEIISVPLERVDEEAERKVWSPWLVLGSREWSPPSMLNVEQRERRACLLLFYAWNLLDPCRSLSPLERGALSCSPEQRSHTVFCIQLALNQCFDGFGDEHLWEILFLTDKTARGCCPATV